MDGCWSVVKMFSVERAYMLSVVHVLHVMCAHNNEAGHVNRKRDTRT